MEGKSVFDRWEKGKELYKGGAVLVHKASELAAPWRTAALKQVGMGKNLKRRSRFIQEVKAHAKMDHPGILAVYEHNLEDLERGGKKGFLVTEFAHMGTLYENVSALKTEPLLALRAFRKICEAIRYAHDQSVLHRDLHPGNILFKDSLENPKVADFGICFTTDDEARNTAAEETLGNPEFAPPEYRRGRVSLEDLTAQGDIYSLGCLLYYMMTAEKAVHGRYRHPSIAEPHGKKFEILNRRIFGRTIQGEIKNRFGDVALLIKELDEVLDRLTTVDEGSASEKRFSESMLEQWALDYFHGHDLECPEDESILHVKPMTPMVQITENLLFMCPECGRSAHFQGEKEILFFSEDELAQIRADFLRKRDPACPYDDTWLRVSEFHGMNGLTLTVGCKYCGRQGHSK